MNNKLRLVFSYYITLNNEISFVHKLHIALLKKYINIFSDIDFIILIDDVNNEDAINNHKSYIIEQLNRNDINFIIEEYDDLFHKIFLYNNQLEHYQSLLHQNEDLQIFLCQ